MLQKQLSNYSMVDKNFLILQLSYSFRLTLLEYKLLLTENKGTIPNYINPETFVHHALEFGSIHI